MDVLAKQPCPYCGSKDGLTLTEDETEVPYFGKLFMFSMKCKDCNTALSDVEAAEEKEPCKITFETSSEKDMSVRVVKSSHASIKIPTLKMSVESANGSEGYVSNIEGLLTRFENILKNEKENAEEDEDKLTAKNLLKKMWKIKLGDIPCKIIIEDMTGNSAIISDKAVVEKLKGKK